MTAPLDLKHLRSVAEAAIPKASPFDAERNNVNEAKFQFATAFNPATALALLDRLEKAETRLKAERDAALEEAARIAERNYGGNPTYQDPVSRLIRALRKTSP